MKTTKSKLKVLYHVDFDGKPPGDGAVIGVHQGKFFFKKNVRDSFADAPFFVEMDGQEIPLSPEQAVTTFVKCYCDGNGGQSHDGEAILKVTESVLGKPIPAVARAFKG